MVCASDENGVVVDQTPPAGAVVPKGATVNIAIGDDGTHLIGIFGTRTPASPANSGQRDNHPPSSHLRFSPTCTHKERCLRIERVRVRRGVTPGCP